MIHEKGMRAMGSILAGKVTVETGNKISTAQH
jgi:hypothetical protein